MSLRLIEVFLPERYQAEVETLLTNAELVETWYTPHLQSQMGVRLLVESTKVETIVDQFANHFEGVEEFRLLLLSVEASVPSPTQAKKTPEIESLTTDIREDLNPQAARLNREEIFDRMASSANVSWVQLAMILLSSTIAAIGILRDNQAVVIGAMVIAPLLKPNMALAVATTLGKRQFVLRALLSGLLGIGLALLLAIAIGYSVPVSLESSEIASRLHVGWADGILALASGTAGAIALTSEERSSIVGVMVSVALLPPLVVLGLLMGAGYWPQALGAALLTTANLICLNLSAVTTFWLQDVRPRQQQDLPKAEQTTWVAYSIWILLLLGLVGVVVTVRAYDLQSY